MVPKFKITPEDHVAVLLTIVVQRAPDASRHAIGGALLDMRIGGESDEKVLLMLADILIDGLRNGNWPPESR